MELGLTEGKIVGLISMEAGEEREEGEERRGGGSWTNRNANAIRQ